MVFSNLVFLYLFLPLNLMLYFLFPNLRWRNAVMVVFSFFFYAWGEPVWVALLLFSASIDYVHGRVIERFRGLWQAKLALASSLTINLGILCLFKYSGFFAENINALLGLSLPVPAFTLPIGISFYTFQTISYVVDVYRGDVKAQTNPLYYLLYLSMYHQLVAGPVIRYADVEKNIRHRRTNLISFSEGLTRFLFGLCKKVLAANPAGALATIYLDGGAQGQTVAGAWFGAILFSIQIYYDFSGYSDMALGLGRMFGFQYKENFNYPYIARSATDFWRRWHISLSSFFRDYVYIPLGGNRKRQYLNLTVVWLLTGLWHGASWNFILWGLYYGAFIALERLFWGGILRKLPAFFQHVYLIVIMLLGWMLFYFTDLGKLGEHLGAMFGLGGIPLWSSQLGVTLMNHIFWLILVLLFCAPVVRGVREWASQRLSGARLSLALCCQAALNLMLLVVCTAQLVGENYNPFLYYRF